MPKKRKIESDDERMARRKLAHDLRASGAREEDALHAMVQDSIRLRGA